METTTAVINATSTIFNSTSTATWLSISKLNESVFQLEKRMIEFGSLEKYFSDILNAQLLIFSIIVASLVSFYFLFSWAINNKKLNEIENNLLLKLKEINKENNKKMTSDVREAKELLNIEFVRKNEELESKLDSLSKKNNSSITILSGEIYRTLGEYWSSQKAFATSFIWWMRAAERYSVEDPKMTRIALGSTKEALSKVTNGVSLSPELIGEYQSLVALIDDVNYKIEKELLEKELKETLNRKV